MLQSSPAASQSLLGRKLGQQPEQRMQELSDPNLLAIRWPAQTVMPCDLNKLHNLNLPSPPNQVSGPSRGSILPCP